MNKIKFALTAILLGLASCSHLVKAPPNPPLPSLAVAADTGKVQQTIMGDNEWLGISVDHKPAEQIRTQIENIGGKSLKNRGESHITVVTPQEFKTLLEKLSHSEITDLAHKAFAKDLSWSAICVARGLDKKNSGLITYYIPVEAKDLFLFRHKISQIFLKHGGEIGKFQPDHYYPHITIGFTDHDLHEQDGVIKDTRNCSFDLITPDGQRLTHWN